MVGAGIFWIKSSWTMAGMLSGMHFAPSGDGRPGLDFWNTIFSLAGWFPFLGLLFIASGLWSTIGRVVRDALLRRRTWYTLIDRAAYIATDLRSRKLDWHELRADLPLELEDGERGAVWFDEKFVHYPGVGV
ncbi:hypothetical protein Rumeso_03683 [Rubellimicrobium mesophilum DSM 19309]|uniref:Uncharacterized protein n=1 Tax=Rubellimicrobium mesophilum DSM 19309 TaxID=442562 RepID=A0A017HK72_9RHOB|nr:hypothetical protein [Rubellimicrobium mesophilum]EYD74730.1 hypothetical protein Rumeso_03683 [Rubellimicrobium mesophilum DSM 19309]